MGGFVLNSISFSLVSTLTLTGATWSEDSQDSGKRPRSEDSGGFLNSHHHHHPYYHRCCPPHPYHNDQVPELEELLSIPAEALQKELCLSREEVCGICNHLSIYSWLLYLYLSNNSILVITVVCRLRPWSQRSPRRWTKVKRWSGSWSPYRRDR